MPFQFKALKIPDVILVEPSSYPDDRGFFLETYRLTAFHAGGIELPLVQDNHSRSRYGVIRGLHFQLPPAAQAKLVQVIHGEIFDVAVDLRPTSRTYGQWVGAFLSDQNHHQLWIPEGFAHGFCVTSPTADVVYKVSHDYSPTHERGVIWNDPSLAIDWPISDPLVSPKDQQLPRFQELVHA